MQTFFFCLNTFGQVKGLLGISFLGFLCKSKCRKEVKELNVDIFQIQYVHNLVSDNFFPVSYKQKCQQDKKNTNGCFTKQETQTNTKKSKQRQPKKNKQERLPPLEAGKPKGGVSSRAKVIVHYTHQPNVIHIPATWLRVKKHVCCVCFAFAGGFLMFFFWGGGSKVFPIVFDGLSWSCKQTQTGDVLSSFSA